MTANIDQNNGVNPVCENNVTLASVQIPEDKGSLQGRRIINTTEKVNAIRKELEHTNVSKIGRIGYALLGVAVAVAGVVAGLFALTMFFPIGIPAAIGISFSGGYVGAKIAFMGVEKNNDGKIAATKNEEFLDWAENNQYDLDVYNIGSHFFNFRTSMIKSGEETGMEPK